MKSNKGFTLIEVMVSIAILAMFFVAMISLVSIISKTINRSTDIKFNAEEAFSDLENGKGNIKEDKIEFSFSGKKYTVNGKYVTQGNDVSKQTIFQPIKLKVKDGFDN